MNQSTSYIIVLKKAISIFSSIEIAFKLNYAYFISIDALF
jgi:hypothetical protein